MSLGFGGGGGQVVDHFEGQAAVAEGILSVLRLEGLGGVFEVELEGLGGCGLEAGLDFRGQGGEGGILLDSASQGEQEREGAWGTGFGGGDKLLAAEA